MRPSLTQDPMHLSESLLAANINSHKSAAHEHTGADRIYTPRHLARRIIRPALAPFMCACMCVHESVSGASCSINTQVFGGGSAGPLQEVFMASRKWVRVCLVHTTGGIWKI